MRQFTVVGYVGDDPTCAWYSHVTSDEQSQAREDAQQEVREWLAHPDTNFKGEYDEQDPLEVLFVFPGHQHPL